ncbi:hypothetical protein ACFW04_014775 [Cataglyphis niger]
MEDEVFEEEYADNISDVPSDAADNEGSDSDGGENIERGEKEDSFPQLRRNRRVRISSSKENPFPPPRRNLRRFRTPTSSDEEENVEDTIGWSNIDRPRVHEFFESATRSRVSVSDCDRVENVVNSFLGDDLLEFIAVETNKYHEQNYRKFKRGKKCGMWRDVTSELKKFLGLKGKDNDYWSTNPIIDTPIFSKTMSRNRFREILKYLHFSDNEKMPPNTDRLYKVQHLIDYFSKKRILFPQKNFSPGRNISIDEGMIPWRGRLNFEVYNPSKITKYGLLVRMACDSITGYILDFKLYSGTGQKIEKTVMDLLKNYSNKWHHVYMDNLYNSVNLAKKLILNKIRLYRGLSEFLKKAKLKVMKTRFARQGEILLQLYKTNKKRDIRMISTIHNADVCDAGKKDKNGNAIFKPKCIIDYNRYMKGVDRADQYLSYYPIYRKTKKWIKKVSFYLINYAIFNAFCIYEYLNNEHIRKFNYHDFLLKLGSAWIKINDDNPSTSRVVRPDPVERLAGGIKHQLVQISVIKKVYAGIVMFVMRIKLENRHFLCVKAVKYHYM